MAEHPEESSGPIKTPKQLVVVVVIALFLLVAIPALISQLATSGNSGGDLSEEAIARRIQPMAQVALATTGGAEKAGRSSEDVYKTVCAACHDSGVANAPKIGDKAAWGPRVAGGLEKLAASGIKGKNAMPPKGGADLSDADFTRVVAWLANKSGASFKEPAAPKASAAPAAPPPAAPAPATAAAAPAPAPAAAAPAAGAGNGKKVSTAPAWPAMLPASPARRSSATRAPGRRASRPASMRSPPARSRAKGAMPPKGGNASIPDADIRAAVEYMAAAAK
ncbi:MAG: c-type cytochrome [Rhodocyclaceae bacterium]|nr:c-type cytochrome [Rhodocyclaceae bacterium]